MSHDRTAREHQGVTAFFMGDHRMWHTLSGCSVAGDCEPWLAVPLLVIIKRRCGQE